jgi:epoxyqueuosine reductase QueG
MQDLPVWSDECESCQRCIGYCPAHAIHVPGKPAAQYTAAPLDALLGE